MNPIASEHLHLVVRWLHLTAGAVWVGLIWFLCFIFAPAARELAGELPRVRRALFPKLFAFLRWSSLATWLSGLALLALVYYGGGVLRFSEGARVGHRATVIIALASILVGWVVYDLLWTSLPDRRIALAVSSLLVVAYAFGMGRILSGRAMVIHVGALFGTLMVCNLWMRIWPAWRRALQSEGRPPGEPPAPPEATPGAASAAAKSPALETAALRSRHNAYLATPLLFAMVSNHFPSVYGSDFAWAWVSGVVAAGWLFTFWLFQRSERPGPSKA